MQFLSALFALTASLASIVSAVPAPRELDIHYKQFSGHPFEVTHFIVDRIQGGNTSIAFDVYNPDPLANVTATCTATWPYGTSGWPSEIYKSCENSSIAFHMDDFTSWTDFVLEVKDTFKDPDVGEAPYDRVTIFGRATFDDDAVSCLNIDNDSAHEVCTQADRSTVRAPIDRSIAKRR